ncbi:MAG: formate/nitrite transporter family protein [Planctomycetota bacterium]
MSSDLSSLESRPPPEIAHAVERVGVAKARMSSLTLLVLGGLAGAFISVGAMFFIVVITSSDLGLGPTRFLGGLAFSLGLVMVVIAGAELFTGNNLIAMAWASRLISARDVVRNWLIVYTGNVLGCLATVALMFWSDTGALGDNAVAATAIRIAHAKADLSPAVALSRGVLCNALVCIAVWLTLGGRTVTDKILAVVLPITAFVTLGAEHSIANWFFLPYAIALEGAGALPWTAAVRNLALVTLGNLIGGTLLVAGVYWLAYLRSTGKPTTVS